jgi:hypothetical protein
MSGYEIILSMKLLVRSSFKILLKIDPENRGFFSALSENTPQPPQIYILGKLSLRILLPPSNISHCVGNKPERYWATMIP